MTAKQVFEALLTELSKVHAPSMLLGDFNYFINKAINQYINKRYNVYDVNQQSTDDLRVLKATTILEPKEATSKYNSAGYSAGQAKLYGAVFEVTLPSDYLHMLNCICVYYVDKPNKCYNKGDYVEFAAKRLTADAWSVVINDYYNRPLPERPYYYLHNVNTSVTLPTNSATDMNGTYAVIASDDPGTVDPNSATNTNLDRVITINGVPISKVEKETAVRYGNASQVRCEIRYGRDTSVYKLKEVMIDYIKAPQTIRLTQEQVDLSDDTSQIMEFPDYVCQEIINELVTLVMENTADPRLQTHVAVSQSIAQPVQQQAQSTK